MKERIRAFLHQFPSELGAMCRRHPVETLLILCVAILGVLTYELDWEHAAPKLFIMSLTAIFAYAVNNFVGNSAWRKVYWVCWMPMIPLLCWGGLEAWFGSWQCSVTALVLLPLFVLMSSRAARNESFITHIIIWLRSGLIAAIFTNVALGLFCAILFSTVYIFGLEGNWTDHVFVYALIITQAIAMPVLFMMMSDRWRGASCSGNRAVEVLLNYIVTPALLIYTFILYLYILRIVVMWSLPRGGVAYMVFGFMLAAMVVQAVQFLLQKRLYDWYFNRFGLIALPMLALFWAGVVRRTSEYGLTDDRVLLVVCGGLMTLFMILFVWKRTGRYLYMSLAAFITFGAIAYVPSLKPEQIAERSQLRRAERAAEQLGLLAPDGKLQLDRIAALDSLQEKDLRNLFNALDYIEYRDTVAFARFGIENMGELRRNIPENIYSYVVSGEYYAPSEEDDVEYVEVFARDMSRVEDLKEYHTLYCNIPNRYGGDDPGYDLRNDTLRIAFGSTHPEFVISGRELVDRQLRKLGVQPNVPGDLLKDRSGEFLKYTDDRMTILFSFMSLERRDSLLSVENLNVDVVLIR